MMIADDSVDCYYRVGAVVAAMAIVFDLSDPDLSGLDLCLVLFVRVRVPGIVTVNENETENASENSVLGCDSCSAT